MPFRRWNRFSKRRKTRKQEKPLGWETPGQARQGKAYRQAVAKELYDAEVRAYVARRVREGAGPAQVAKELGVSRKVAETSMTQSLSRVKDFDRQRHGERHPSDPPLHGEVLGPSDTPEERAFILQAFAFRKRALPIDEIAMLTGRTEAEVRHAVTKRLKELENDELSEASTARRMMLEQLDAMIAAITVASTGRDINGNPSPVVLEAIDRMCRLLDQKAKLLGLNAPQKIDLSHRIEVLARESGYDVEELRQITADVLQSYSPAKLR